MFNVRNKSYLTLMDYTPRQMEYLLNLAEDLKKAKYAGTEQPKLKGKNIALIFEKSSTRTRCSFEVAAYDQGAHVTYLGPSGSHMGHKESVKDTARVLGGMFDGIEYRGFSQRTVETLAKYSGVPVWNGLTDEDHPTQVLADFLTAKEVLKKEYKDIKFAFVGDGQDNVSNALMIGAAKMGMTYHVVCPKELNPEKELLEKVEKVAAETGAEIKVFNDLAAGVADMDVIYGDVWVSMGEADSVWEERIKLLQPYQIDKKLMGLTNNSHAIFEHCLPAFHNIDTEVGKEIFEKYGISEMEVTDEVFESSQSVVFQEAENRMHTIKAIMVATLGE
ncbi:MAG: ornithine carbamoyltransferase [Liquorilactobacillus nagelii]|uniref:Ornithine carbamoyltransferase n=1 Tax=Liquorilactobacillus nagelii TaxID=82688 RepID=A0A3S6QWR5_9LACO|nr:ornithine carbamoyltransferase [Liquorilactobacillus nagelii]AUJ32602.1 ornithine carbamoyltransferase [Liquorilactobacillus nagelii]MCC7616758.1 ornithine carbamoyltransferase [Liquorilactobacillus nagelii]MCI1634212.1 ornithine carbamoyltransferase [Liquorilactobacillus nagelii]MCI1699891.1 ornithine carbamoyltransferase [Liquorilactobacillus nagelii]MCI1921340.1 ornithine carbamoyltransferase [Liquorilactobacillus nagelii]